MSWHLLQSRWFWLLVSQGISHNVSRTAHNDPRLRSWNGLPVCAARRFSVDAATTLRLCWRTTSVRGSSCSPSPAPRPSLCTTFRMTSLSVSCITSTPMTLRFVHGFSLTFCFPGLLCRVWKLWNGFDDLGYKTKSERKSVSLLLYKRATDKTGFITGSHEIMETGGAGRVAKVDYGFWTFSPISRIPNLWSF